MSRPPLQTRTGSDHFFAGRAAVLAAKRGTTARCSCWEKASHRHRDFNVCRGGRKAAAGPGFSRRPSYQCRRPLGCWPNDAGHRSSPLDGGAEALPTTWSAETPRFFPCFVFFFFLFADRLGGGITARRRGPAPSAGIPSGEAFHRKNRLAKKNGSTKEIDPRGPRDTEKTSPGKEKQGVVSSGFSLFSRFSRLLCCLCVSVVHPSSHSQWSSSMTLLYTTGSLCKHDNRATHPEEGPTAGVRFNDAVGRRLGSTKEV